MVLTYDLGLFTSVAFDKSDFNKFCFKYMTTAMINTEQPVVFVLQKL